MDATGEGISRAVCADGTPVMIVSSGRHPSSLLTTSPTKYGSSKSRYACERILPPPPPALASGPATGRAAASEAARRPVSGGVDGECPWWPLSEHHTAPRSTTSREQGTRQVCGASTACFGVCKVTSRCRWRHNAETAMRKYNEAQGTLERAKTAELSQAQALAEARRHTDDATQMVGGSLFVCRLHHTYACTPVTPHHARSLPARNREREDECGDKVEREVRGIHGSCERWVGVVGMYPCVGDRMWPRAGSRTQASTPRCRSCLASTVDGRRAAY